jgi:phenylpyruvate tautomerase PptA (4-oxalocrotonate tautomerase family)
MPLYQCTSPAGLLRDDSRARIAEEITRLHTEATGAPAAFVNVLFLERPPGIYFTAGKPSQNSLIVGEIRQGRDLATRQALLNSLSQMWTRLTGQDAAQLLVALKETPSENVMEAGLIFPPPGQEAQWARDNRARLAELGWEVPAS